MEDDWDLQAVVRGCSTNSTNSTATTTAAATTTTTTTTTNINNTNNSILQDFNPISCFSSPEQSGNLFSLPGPFNARNSVEELHELYQPFFPKSHTVSSQNTPISSLPSSFEVSYHTQTKQQHQQQQPKLQSHAAPLTPAITATNTTHSQTQRSKRRKNQIKKVCQVPAESLSSDVWSWRKYGQKPIKGSPYPRGYYRCSSSKGCLARKQVERNRSDPGMFIVTYTGEHNHPAPTHRNSLAGTTRQKPLTPQTLTASDSNKPSSTSPATSMDEELVPQNIKTESREELVEEEEEDEFGFSDMVLGDDFFTGLEGIASPVTGECFSDQLNSFCDVGLCLL